MIRSRGPIDSRLRSTSRQNGMKKRLHASLNSPSLLPKCQNTAPRLISAFAAIAEMLVAS